jgi:hypothetical protein
MLPFNPEYIGDWDENETLLLDSPNTPLRAGPHRSRRASNGRQELGYTENSPLLRSSGSVPHLTRKSSSRRLSSRTLDPIQNGENQERYSSDKHGHGSSTFGQTVSTAHPSLFRHQRPLTHIFQLFNCIAILVGIGMLSEPLAFSYAGWVGGTVLLVMYAAVGCYTYTDFYASTTLI